MLEILTGLSPKSSAPGGTPGGVRTITRDMIAGSLRGLPRQTQALVRDCCLSVSRPEAAAVVLDAARRFRLPPVLARLAVDSAKTFARCVYCNGTGENIKTRRQCGQCTNGRAVPSSDRLAMLSGMDPGTVRRLHYRRFCTAVREIEADLAEAGEHIRVQLTKGGATGRRERRQRP